MPTTIQGGAKKWNMYALHRYLLNTGFVFVDHRSRSYTKTKQLIFCAILLMLEFILNILWDVIHDVFIKHVYNAAREKRSTFCVLMYLPSVNLKTGLPITRT